MSQNASPEAGEPDDDKSAWDRFAEYLRSTPSADHPTDEGDRAEPVDDTSHQFDQYADAFTPVVTMLAQIGHRVTEAAIGIRSKAERDGAPSQLADAIAASWTALAFDAIGRLQRDAAQEAMYSRAQSRDEDGQTFVSTSAVDIDTLPPEVREWLRGHLGN